MISRLPAILTALLVLAAAPARADEKPQPAAEACTLDAERRPGETCLLCSTWDGDPAKCLKHLSPQGYQRRCRTAESSNGATTTWSEVWCRAERPAPK